MKTFAAPTRRWLLGTFLALSLADLYLTWRLFTVEGLGAAERNPVADWVLDQYGWAGVALLKLSTVALVGVAASAIYHRARPRTGTGLLTGCCALLGSVVLYSCLLLYFPGTVSAESDDLEAAIAENNQVLDAEVRSTTDRIYLKNRLVTEVLGRRRPLAEAVAAVEASEEPGSVRIRHMHWLYPNCTDQQCLALNLMEFALIQHRGQPEVMDRLTRELAGIYEASYGTPAPRCWLDVSQRTLSSSGDDFRRPAATPSEQRGWPGKHHRRRCAAG